MTTLLRTYAAVAAVLVGASLLGPGSVLANSGWHGGPSFLPRAANYYWTDHHNQTVITNVSTSRTVTVGQTAFFHIAANACTFGGFPSYIEYGGLGWGGFPSTALCSQGGSVYAGQPSSYFP